MSTFTNELNFFKDGEGLFRTSEAFTFYESDTLEGWHITVPVGFVSNGASIPGIAQFFCGLEPMDPRWAQAAFMHDALVGETCNKLKVKNSFTDEERYLSWEEAAIWFDNALKVLRKNGVKCPTFNRWIFTKAIRIWGNYRGYK